MIRSVIGKFNPGRTGIAKVLGELETEVMEIIWQRGTVSVREVHETLKQEREIAYTTVMTIMGRLVDKGILVRGEKEGHAYLFHPSSSREEFTRNFVRDVIDGLLAEFAEPAFNHFLDRMSSEDTDKLMELEKALKERLQKGEK